MTKALTTSKMTPTDRMWMAVEQYVNNALLAQLSCAGQWYPCASSADASLHPQVENHHGLQVVEVSTNEVSHGEVSFQVTMHAKDALLDLFELGMVCKTPRLLNWQTA